MKVTGYTGSQIASNIYNWLQVNPNTDIILLHIGTNNIDTSRINVQDILNEIDRFEQNNNRQIWVIVARIINRSTNALLSDRTKTTTYNNHIADLVNGRINDGDNLLLVDMENDAGINYSQ